MKCEENEGEEAEICQKESDREVKKMREEVVVYRKGMTMGKGWRIEGQRENAVCRKGDEGERDGAGELTMKCESD